MTNGGGTEAPNMNRAREILGRFAPLSWFRAPLRTHPKFRYTQIAHLGWRFSDPHEELKPVFEAAVRDSPRNAEWVFKAQRNWLILPTRLLQETASCGGDFGLAQQTLTQNDQEFCIAASEDMELILNSLDRVSREYGD
ncbi:hypothetical protein [Streptomyces sp. NPDC057686]|uniref:hypothetical protein n=1 Tax=Streptomyces sp. NPDC057686 TaxID=3346212 RepID=UPI0036842093